MASRAATQNRPDERSIGRQMLGGLVAALAAFIMVSLLTYSQADPSPNHSTNAAVTNAGGIAGAYISDILLQVLGLASALAVIVPASWSIRLMVGKRVRHVWMRTTALLFGMVLFAALLAPIEPWVSWPIGSGLGGTIGELLFTKGRTFLGVAMCIFLCAFASLAMLALAFGMTAREWKTQVSRAAASARYVGMLGYALYEAWQRRREARMEDEDEDALPWYKRIVQMFRRGEEYEEEDEEYEEEEDDDEPVLERSEEPRQVKISKKVERAAPKPVRATKSQASLALDDEEYEKPPMNLLSTPGKSRKSGMSESALAQNAKLLESVLEDFGVHGQITEIRPGPVVTLYELEPAPGTKSSRVIGLADDIARSMSAVSARIAVIPGRNGIGIELPNANRETVFLREMLESDPFEEAESKLPLALGKDIGGAPIVVDLAKMPHLLVAGTTGSGKSVAINTMIMSLVYRLTPEECKFIMIDPKMLELSIYDGIPHLLSPVVTEPGKAVVALKWTVKEMENRYRLMSNLSVRNIDGYNKKIREAKGKGKELTRTVQTGFDVETGEPIIEEVPLDMNELPFIVVVVDEMADLMLVAGKDIESSIQRLAQMARAAGIHIIMATQRPSVDVITGVIKANFPTRISFQVTSRIDSRTILGEQGAEQLLGQGDMLYMAGGGRITRIHGPFVTDKEVELIVDHLKAQGTPNYIDDVTRDEDEMGEGFGEDGERDEMYDQAVAIVTRDRKASTSYIQRCLKIGYNRAATIIEQMERAGVISAANHVGKREVLTREEDA